MHLFTALQSSPETEVLSGPQRLSNSTANSRLLKTGLEHNRLSGVDTTPNQSTRPSHFNKTPQAPNYVCGTITPNQIPTIASNSVSYSSALTKSPSDITLSDSRVCSLRPVSFSLPKRSCVLLHQSAAAFIQASTLTVASTAGAPGLEKAKTADTEVLNVDHWDRTQNCSEAPTPDWVSLDLDTGENRTQLSLCDNHKDLFGLARTDLDLNTGENADVDSVLIQDNSPQLNSDNVDDMHLHFSEEIKDLPSPDLPCLDSISSHTNEAERPAQTKHRAFSNCAKESMVLLRPKEPFCQVLSRDGSTVLLWPSEMVSYTKTFPSISFSVNPLLHDFRAHNRAKEEERRKPSVIKQANWQQRQGSMEGEGELSRDERDRGEGGGQLGSPVEVVAHCSSSNSVANHSGCPDESALKFHPDSVQECHLALLQKKGRRRKRRRGVRRGMRKRGRRKRREKADKKDSARQIIVGRTEEGGGKWNNGEVYWAEGRSEIRMKGHEQKIRGDQAGTNDEKRAEPLSNLPVTGCNRCNQLCAQVNSQASRCQSQQSASKWGQDFRMLHGGGSACNAVISPIPGSDIGTACCPAITPNPAQSDRDMWEPHAEKEALQISVVRENSRRAMIKAAQDAKESHVVISCGSFACVKAASEQEMTRERECDGAISLDTVCREAQTIPAGPTSRYYRQDTATQGKMRSTGAGMTLQGGATSKEMTTTVTSRKRRSNSPEAGRPLAKKQKRVKDLLKKSDMTSDLNTQEVSCKQKTEPLTHSDNCQLSTEINRTSANTVSHFIPKHNLSLNIEKTLYTSKPYNCCHSKDSRDRQLRTKEQDQTIQNSPVHCQTWKALHPLSESQRNAESTPEDSGPASDNPLVKKDKHNERCHNQSYNKGDQWRSDVGQLQSNTNEEPALHTRDRNDASRTELLCEDSFSWSANDAQNKMFTQPNPLQTAAFSGGSCKTNDRCNPKQINKRAQSQVDETQHHKTTLSDSVIDSKSCSVIDQNRPSRDDIDGGQCDYCSSNHVTNCNYPEKNTNGGDVELISTNPEQTGEERDLEKKRQEEEERKREQREKRGEWEKEWLRRREQEDRRREWGIDLEHPEKRLRFPHRLPLPPPPLSSSLSFHHTLIRQHLSLLPPPLALPSYPHLIPSFSPHLCHVPPPPPPLPPSFYPSSPVPLLDGPYTLTAAFHPPALYAPPHPAVVPIQMLF